MDALENPRVEHRDGFSVVGLSTRATSETDLSAHWADFDARHNTYADLTDSREAFGVEYDFDTDTDSFTYFAGIEPSPTASVPSDAERVDVPAGTYAVFTTRIEDIGETMDRVYDEWFPNSNYARANGPEFEHYGPDFDPADPDATLDVYVPVVN
ncbi:GyrI-like domain-containing protein [Haloarchaeobius sp. DFWS5]|uniref:GyrI-like domain-containing protein n=1 Tax=Haloarchaeobius sp. DFWS5 TaxID=3446114 RepID=UPI003EB9BAEC